MSMIDNTQPAPMDAATIEACARVAEEYADGLIPSLKIFCVWIAAAIRALPTATLPARQPAAITAQDVRNVRYECVDGGLAPASAEDIASRLNARLNLRGAAPSADTEALTAEVQPTREDALFAALQKLERAASDVNRKGATTGTQWVGLSFALATARAALNPASMETGR